MWVLGKPPAFRLRVRARRARFGPMPLRVIRRRSTQALTISSTVAGQRIRRRAQSDNPALAREEAAAIEAELLRTGSYLAATPRSENQQARVARLLRVIGNTRLGAFDQQLAIRFREEMLRPGVSSRAYDDAILMPLRAILHHAPTSRLV